MGLITIILSIFILGGVNLAYECLYRNNITPREKNIEETVEEKVVNNEEKIANNEEIIEEKLARTSNLHEQIWQVEIPAINLIAPIAEGTTQKIMRNYVGHFENTKLWRGNIGLAAHNRRISN